MARVQVDFVIEAQSLLRRRKVFQNITEAELNALVQHLKENGYCNGYMPLSNKEIAITMGRDPEDIHERQIQTKL